MGAIVPPVGVIDGLYDAALEPQRWQAALAEISANFDGLPTHLVVDNALSGEVLLFESTTLDQRAKEAFKRDYSTVDRNPLLHVAMNGPVGMTLQLPEMIGEDRFNSSGVYNDLIKPNGVRNYMSVVAVRDGSLFAGLELFAPPTFQSPSRAARARFEATARHLGRALKLSGHLGKAPIGQKTLVATLDCLRTAVFLVDGEGHVAWNNKLAAALLQGKDGLILSCGKLTAERPGDEKALRSAFNGPADATVRVARPSGARSLILQVHRLWNSLASRQASIAVFVNDAGHNSPSASSLVSAFGLSSAEARVAAAISRSRGIGPAAKCLGLSPNTVKATLQRVFAKTETRSQVELVRLIASSIRDGGDQVIK